MMRFGRASSLDPCSQSRVVPRGREPILCDPRADSTMTNDAIPDGDEWAWLRGRKGRHFVKSLREQRGRFEWEELRRHVRGMIERFARRREEILSIDRNEAWCQEEAARALVELQHLPSIADGWGGASTHGSPEGGSIDGLRVLEGVIAFRDPPRGPASGDVFTADEHDALTALLALHLLLVAESRECAVILVPALPRHPALPGLAHVLSEQLGAYSMLPLVESTIREHVVAGRAAPPPLHSELGTAESRWGTDRWSTARWSDAEVVAAAVASLRGSDAEGAFGFSWCATVSDQACLAHARRTMEMLSGLVGLSTSQRGTLLSALLLVVEMEQVGRPIGDGVEGSAAGASPHVHTDKHAECVVPTDLWRLASDPWWGEVGVRFATRLHEYVTAERGVEGRFLRSLHFWSRAESAARGVSAYDVADRFLDYLTAIEVALSSDRQGVVASLATRVAGVVGGDARLRLETSQELKRLYGVRSSYVHDGAPHVPRSALDAVREFARLTLRDIARWCAAHGGERPHADYVRGCDLRSLGG